MSYCPSCRGLLSEGRDHYGMLWQCPTCGGLALAMAVLRKKLTSPTLTTVWRAAQEGQGTPGRPCPLCDRRMIEVSSGIGEPPVLVDVCSLCSYLWFDPAEFEKLPALPEDPAIEKLPPPVRALLDIPKVDTKNRRYNSLLPDGSDDSPWNSIMWNVFFPG
ncbi:MAG: TFIIB-type zinc ribbon-containing protein [Armatimonadota bacterium]